MRTPLSTALFAVLMWGLLLFRFGYEYGTNDQSELLTYASYLKDATLYPSDFFIQGLHAAIPNERTVFCTFLRFFLGHMEGFNFLFHFLTTFFLVAGLEQLLFTLFRNRTVARIGLMLSLLVFNDYGLGNNEVYTASFQASNIACAILAWTFLGISRGRLLIALCLLIAATWVQSLEGLDVAMVLFASGLWWVKDKEISLRTYSIAVLLYLGLAGWYLLWIFVSKQSGSTHTDSSKLFYILFEFRHPHHFIYSTFPFVKKVMYWIFTFLAWWWFHTRREHFFARFVSIASLALVFYIFSVDVLHLNFVANFQWYKLAQWIKLFGVTAMAHIVLQPGTRKFLTRIPLRISAPFCTLLLLFLFILMFYIPRELPFGSVYQFVPGYKETYADIDIALKAKRLTPKDAVFLQPFSFTALKFHSKRSSYVDFKANVRHAAFAEKWYNRILDIYGLPPGTEKTGFELRYQADWNFNHPAEATVEHWKSLGVTHLITAKNAVIPNHKPLTENAEYALYAL